MYKELNNYLFQHKSISLPGLGTIFLEKQPSKMDIDQERILPPVYRFRFDKYFDAPDKDFFSHLAAEKNMKDYEAIKWYNEFAFDLRNKIRVESKAEWEGVGVLKKDEEGNIVLEPLGANPGFIEPVQLNFVAPHKEEEVFQVQDTAYTSPELVYADRAVLEKNNWWLFALIAAALALAILLFHFTSNGWQLPSTGNQQNLELSK